MSSTIQVKAEPDGHVATAGTPESGVARAMVAVKGGAHAMDEDLCDWHEGRGELSKLSQRNGQAAIPLSRVEAHSAAPVSPSRSIERKLIPLDRLIPIGTLVLPHHRLNPDVPPQQAEDGWINLSRDTLQAITLVTAEPAALVVTPPSPSPSNSRSVAGKKRKASTAGGSSSKKAKLSAHPHLDALVALSSAVGARATVRLVGDSALVRVYLVPQDLPELKDAAYKYGRLQRPAGSRILGLLSAVRVSPEEWAGELSEEGDSPLFMEETDKRSLLEVYRDISSPIEDTAYPNNLEASDEIKARLLWAFDENPEGVQAELFPYQRATLAKMLARELAPQRIPRPSYLQRRTALGTSNSEFYISLDGDVRFEPPTDVDSKGGILAEDMGVGKTLIVLSLVMATLSELPKLEGTSTYLDGSAPSPPPVLLTDVSVEFPFPAEIAEARKLKTRVPDLLPGVQLDEREMEQYQDALSRQAQEDAEVPDLPFPSLRSLMVHHVKSAPVAIRYPHYDEAEGELPLPQRLFDTLQASPPFYRVFPSPEQRESREGRKGAFKPLKVVVAPTTLVIVPTDLVRQWKDEIDKHIEKNKLRVLVLRTAKDKFRSPEEMATFDLILMSVARFSDAADANNTSLRSVHWRRIVIDEGHVLANGTRMRKLAEELRTEARWAVSGTPSTNLRGGHSGEESALFATTSASGGDRTDLDRLGQLFSRFIQHPAFPRPDSLRKLVKSSVCGIGERAYRLATVFDRAIIRHHTDVIKPVLNLPPLTTRKVEIEMEEGERKVYNALLAFFASNSVTSQRVDVDYLFHKSKRQHLDTLCSNLATATTFFGSTEFASQVFEARVYAERSMTTKRSVDWSVEDFDTQRKVMQVLQEALDDREVTLTAGTPAVAFEVRGLDDELVRTFLGLKAANNPLGRTLVSQNELVRLRVDLKELQHADVKGWDDDEELIEELITFEDKRKRIDARPKNYVADPDEEPLFKKRGKKDKTPIVPLPDDSVFRQVQLVRTTSSKINYIVSELRKYPDDKFIVFSSSNVDLLFSNLSETLDLVGIPHAIFASGHSRIGDRGSVAQRFNATTAHECQAILIDAKLGGRGITLTSATRMIFLEPLWQPDLEVQAMKRAHRLGQTKPVDLQILLVKTTFEEALLHRRGELKSEDFAKKIKAPQQDTQLRTLLQRAQYLEPAERAKQGLPVSPAFDPPVMLIRDDGMEGMLLKG
ncbi:hypothetical protein Rhopal_002089-T1 [Rhodotorula paludigena]|uniref:Uncharacterized protein n=1 Tax=Rhodotorula paludigena TaxID=86838 RepID=A0AAV5GI01_9BASI|nr:hypothetical protein Rhopal_002089-T1 [Rhodotorula paludigena]